MFGSRAKKRALRIFFATDVHGSDRCFRKFLAAAESYDADALVLGGDIAGKGLVPIRSDNGTLTAKVRGETVTVPRAEEDRAPRRDQPPGLLLGSRQAPRSSSGWRTTRSSWTTRFTTRSPSRSRAGAGWPRNAWRRGCAASSRPATTTPKQSTRCSSPRRASSARRRELRELGPVLLASCGDVTPTPWNTEREYPEEELAAARGDPRPGAAGQPSGRQLSLPAVRLRARLRRRARRQAAARHPGRPAEHHPGRQQGGARDVIKRYEPEVGLHGHIHESRGAQKIGARCASIPGSDYSADVLRGAIVDFDADGSYIDFLLTSG